MPESNGSYRPIPRALWHDGDLWFYRYHEGGFEGYRALRSRRRAAPDLRWYADGRRPWTARKDRSGADQ